MMDDSQYVLHEQNTHRTTCGWQLIAPLNATSSPPLRSYFSSPLLLPLLSTTALPLYSALHSCRNTDKALVFEQSPRTIVHVRYKAA